MAKLIHNHKTLKKHRLYSIWKKVPVDYYQKGIKTNFLQWIWHTRKFIMAKKIIQDFKFEKLLDVGCASGYMLSNMSKIYPKAKYFGVDVYDNAINFARKTYPNLNFKIASAENLPFRSNSFDLIMCYETIEHIENPKKALNEIKRIMKADGNFILAMDSGTNLFKIVWFIWENSFGSAWRGAHIHPFHHLQLETLIKSSGLKIKNKRFSHLGMEVIFTIGK